jgi:hypothetical protein
VPDHLHVNHVAAVGDRLLATCFADGTLRDLRTFEVAARLPGAFLHDGIVHDERCGSRRSTARSSSSTRTRSSSGDGSRRSAPATSVGVGASPSATRHLLVGLTEVRRGRLPRHRWAEREPEGSETSVLLLDRADGRLLARVDLSDAARHSKLYSVLPTDKRMG